MRCCEAWKPIEDCFDTSSFECIDFQRLCQIIADLTRETLEEREAEITNLPWTQTEKTLLQPDAEVDNVFGVTRNLCYLSLLSQMKRAIPWKMKMNLEEDCEYWRTIFQAREEGPRHHQYEDILRFVQKAPDDFRWTIDRTEFDELIAMKKDSAPDPDGIPYGAYRCAGGLGSQFPFNAYQSLLEGGTVPEHFAESRTVLIPKTCDIDDQGRIIRSPHALRPLTLCKCDCKLLTSAICRGLYW